MVITSLSRSEGPRFEPGWNHFCFILSLLKPIYLSRCSYSTLYIHTTLLYSLVYFLSYLPSLLSTLKKQRREVSINRPASYEPAALPLRHPAFYHLPTYPLPFPFLFFYIQKKLHRRESNPGRKRERLACYQLHHNGLLTSAPSTLHLTTP